MVQQKKILGFQSVIFPEDGGFTALAPEMDIATQGDTLEEAESHLREALELRLEGLSSKELAEIKSKLGKKVRTTKLNIQVPA